MLGKVRYYEMIFMKLKGRCISYFDFIFFYAQPIIGACVALKYIMYTNVLEPTLVEIVLNGSFITI